MIILGIDPGTRRTGYGILDLRENPRVLHAGVIRLSDDLALSGKLAELHRGLAEIYERFQPVETVIEKIFFGKNADSAFKLGHARGICMLAAANANSVVVEYAAKYVKKAVTGSGAADKEHVRVIVTQLLRYTPESTELDITDALALALCHWQELNIGATLKRGLAGSL